MNNLTYPGKYHKVKGEVLHYSKCSYFNVFFGKEVPKYIH